MLKEVNRLRIIIKRFLESVNPAFDYVALELGTHDDKYTDKPSVITVKDSLANSINIFDNILSVIKDYKKGSQSDLKQFIEWSKIEESFNEYSKKVLKTLLIKLNDKNLHAIHEDFYGVIKKIRRLYENLDDSPSSILKLFKATADQPVIVANNTGIVIKYNDLEKSSVADVAKILSSWNRILLPFARLNRLSSDSYYVIKVEQGSLILTIGAVIGIVVSFGKVVNDLLKAISTGIEIKKQLLEMKKMKNDFAIDIINDLESALKFDWDKSINGSIETIIKESNYDENDIEEIRNGLLLSGKEVKKILIDEGGDIQLLLDKETLEKNEDVLILKDQIATTKKQLIERQQLLLSELLPNE